VLRRPVSAGFQSRSPLEDQTSAGGAVRALTRRAARGSYRTVFDRRTEASMPEEDFDFSTPEGEAAIRAAIALVLEVRELETSPLARRVRLYQRTLGLAVIPVLLREAFLAAKKRGSLRRRGAR
jgi:hypothetical protein